MAKREQIRGGNASGMRASMFSPSALRKGTRVELEHVRRPGKRVTAKERAIAREIAMDHLAESPRYYDELAKMERKLSRNRPVPKASKRAIGALLGGAVGAAVAGQVYCRRGNGVVLSTVASTGVGMAGALVGALVADALVR